MSAGSYHVPHLQRGIRWLKFKGIHAVAPVLAEILLPRLLLIDTLPNLRQRALIIPIPLHARRLRERGFNQSALIADHVSNMTGIPLCHALVRHRSTWAQSSLPPEMRAANIKNSFALAPDYEQSVLKDRTMAIFIDDVTTSGSTLKAATETLYPAFAQASADKSAGTSIGVWGLTVARG